MKKRWLLLTVVPVLLLGFSGATGISTAAGGVLYVKPGGTGDCSDWVNACTLKTALGAAADGDEIWVAEGTHKPTGGTLRSAAFQLKSGVAVYGGFVGTESRRDQRDWALHETILSGDIGRVGDDSDNSYNVVGGSGTDATAILDGFTITGGNGGRGAGMHNSAGSPTLTNVTFTGNCGGYYGGGMYNCGGASPILTNVTFTGNSAERGGGMYNYNGGSPTLVNVTFSGNSARYGGAMHNKHSNPTVTNCILWGNTASQGAQIYNWSSSASVTYSDIQGGYAGQHNIDADPQFVDADGPDDIVGTLDDNLRLRVSSPAINRGNNDALPADTLDLDGDGDTAEKLPFDLDGNPRILDGTVDMGAYERLEVQQPTPTPVPVVEEVFVPEVASLLLLGSGLAGLAGHATLRLRSGHSHE